MIVPIITLNHPTACATLFDPRSACIMKNGNPDASIMTPQITNGKKVTLGSFI